MALSINLPTNHADGEVGHTATHNATNVAVNQVGAELDAHEVDTTNVHGIVDTAALLTAAKLLSGANITLTPGSGGTLTIAAAGGSGGSGGALPATVLHRLVESGGAYPARPSVGYVDFLGPTDPGSALLSGDTWTQTASESVPGATVPGAPTRGGGGAGAGSAAVSFTAPSSNGGAAITGYTATSTPGGIVGTGSSSPVTVTGLTNGTSYTFKVKATNSVGTGAESTASNSITPSGSTSAITDSFTGANGTAWSSLWKAPPGTPNIFAGGWDIQNNHGRISGTSLGNFEATNRRFNLPNAANWRIRYHLVTPPAVSGWNFHLILQAASWDSDTHMPTTAYMAYQSNAGYAFISRVNEVETTLQSTTVLTATDRWIDVKVVGGVLSYKAWSGTLAEAPTSFTTVTNGTPITGAGQAGIVFAANGGVAGLTEILIDDVLVDNNPS